MSTMNWFKDEKLILNAGFDKLSHLNAVLEINVLVTWKEV